MEELLESLSSEIFAVWFLIAAARVTRHSDTGGLDLIARDPRGFERDESVFAVCKGIAAMCLALHTSALDASVFDSLRH